MPKLMLVNDSENAEMEKKHTGAHSVSNLVAKEHATKTAEGA